MQQEDDQVCTLSSAHTHTHTHTHTLCVIQVCCNKGLRYRHRHFLSFCFFFFILSLLLLSLLNPHFLGHTLAQRYPPTETGSSRAFLDILTVLLSEVEHTRHPPTPPPSTHTHTHTYAPTSHFILHEILNHGLKIPPCQVHSREGTFQLSLLLCHICCATPNKDVHFRT